MLGYTLFELHQGGMQQRKQGESENAMSDALLFSFLQHTFQQHSTVVERKSSNILRNLVFQVYREATLEIMHWGFCTVFIDC